MFEEIFDRLQREAPSRELQIAVGDALANTLEQVADSLGYWEKKCLAQAIGTFASNLGNGRNITDIWLRASLLSAENALASVDQRNEKYGRFDEKVNALTYEDLSKALQQLRTGI